MSKTAVYRRSLAAMAGVTSGIASVAFGPAVAAVAAEPGPSSDSPSSVIVKGTKPAPTVGAVDAQGTCFSWTVVHGFVRTTPVHFNIPTTAQGNNVRDCILVRGNITDGVFKVQDAINRCYPQFSAGVGFDGNYGSNTQRAVRDIQSAVGVNPDGAYGPNTKTAMVWPVYRDIDNVFIGCGLLRI